MEMLWFGIAAAMVAVYVVMDGFDFGSGALHLVVARDDRERRQVLAAIGPFWDGNEVWLLAAGGVLFLAFPKVLASGLSGFYLAIMLVLWTLILRGISIEFRSHVGDAMWRSFWDGVFFVASTLAPVLFGAALGNLLRGVPLDERGWFALPLFESFSPLGALGILDWYTVLAGLFALASVAHHGALFLAVFTSVFVAEIGDKTQLLAMILAAVIGLVAGTVSAEWWNGGSTSIEGHVPITWEGEPELPMFTSDAEVDLVATFQHTPLGATAIASVVLAKSAEDEYHRNTPDTVSRRQDADEHYDRVNYALIGGGDDRRAAHRRPASESAAGRADHAARRAPPRRRQSVEETARHICGPPGRAASTKTAMTTPRTGAARLPTAEPPRAWAPFRDLADIDTTLSAAARCAARAADRSPRGSTPAASAPRCPRPVAPAPRTACRHRRHRAAQRERTTGARARGARGARVTTTAGPPRARPAGRRAGSPRGAATCVGETRGAARSSAAWATETRRRDTPPSR